MENIEEEEDWPRDIILYLTDEMAWQIAGEGTSEDAMLYQKGYEAITVSIESWDELDIPEGYEFAFSNDEYEYDIYLESKD